MEWKNLIRWRKFWTAKGAGTAEASRSTPATEGELNLAQKIRKEYPHVNFGDVLNVCPRYRTVYITNPKSGCSTIKLMLYKAQTGDKTLDPTDVHSARILPKPSELGWEYVVRMLSGEAFRFSFVRNPIDRVISAYSDKLVRQHRKFGGEINRVLGRPEADKITFEEFLTALEIQEPHEMNGHWRPQFINIMHDHLKYDFIGKLETFAEDIDVVLRRTGIPRAPIVHRNKQKRHFALAGRPDLKRRIERIYQEDFNRFGYSPS